MSFRLLADLNGGCTGGEQTLDYTSFDWTYVVSPFSTPRPNDGLVHYFLLGSALLY